MTAYRWLATAAAVLALVACLVLGLHALYTAGFDAGQAHEQKLAADAADARRKEDQRAADKLVGEAHAETLAAQNVAAQLQQELARHDRYPLVRATTRCPARDAVGPVPGAASSAPGVEAGGVDSGRRVTADDAQLQDEPGGGTGLRLTAGAVRVWNSAIAGALVPAGACGAADGAAGACAADTDITLDEAWANQVENATRCRANSVWHRKLIEFVRQRQSASAPTH